MKRKFEPYPASDPGLKPQVRDIKDTQSAFSVLVDHFKLNLDKKDNSDASSGNSTDSVDKPGEAVYNF